MNITTVTPVSGVNPSQRSASAGAEQGVNAKSTLAEQPAASNKTPPEMPREQLDSVVASMQTAIQSISRDISFQVDDSSGRVVVKVVDGSSGEVVRQIPSEEALELAVRLEDMRSLLFREEA